MCIFCIPIQRGCFPVTTHIRSEQFRISPFFRVSVDQPDKIDVNEPNDRAGQHLFGVCVCFLKYVIIDEFNIT